MATLIDDVTNDLITWLRQRERYPKADRIWHAALRWHAVYACDGELVSVARLGTTYFHSFRSPALEYAGARVLRDPALPGLVMESADGGVWIDLPQPSRPSLDVNEVVADQVEAGTFSWGPRFLGVRVCVLRRPQASLLYRPDGRVLRVGTSLDWLIRGCR